MLGLETTVYSMSDTAAGQVLSRLQDIEERVMILRRAGTLSEETLRSYYGETRFSQIAESNAIEGSTLSVGETELAILKGTTITGHDPAYVRDAIALDRALVRMAELAKDRSCPTNISQLHEIHGLLLGDRPGAGVFRKDRVLIRGSRHMPPKTWGEVMTQMEHWEKWSNDNQGLPGPIRSAVLHAWLAHIHPFIDGNGRTARAIGNLELIRAGYPSITIKRVERDRYIESLAESDDGGDIRSFVELVFDRVEGAVVGLEHSVRLKQGFDPLREKIRLRQESQLRVWETSVGLLASLIELKVSSKVEAAGGTCRAKMFSGTLDIEGYQDLCNGFPIPRSWALTVTLDVPGLPRVEKLAYYGHRSNAMVSKLNEQGGPSLFWSSKNPSGFPKWLSDGIGSPYAVELTTSLGNGDEWYARFPDNAVKTLQTTELAQEVAAAICSQLVT